VGAGSGPGSGGSGPPRLVQGPSGADLARVYPRQARPAGRPGGAQLRCRIRLDRRLDRCRVVGEDPVGQGFGAAALEASAYFRFTPATREGRPAEDGEITIGVDFPAGRPRR
jgi:protein TonB